MKKIFLIITLAILITTVGCEIGTGRQSITIVKKQSSYSFIAAYPKDKTDMVMVYLVEKFKQEKFSARTEGDVVLVNGANFYIKSEPGYIKINFKKSNNTELNYSRLIEICQGIKDKLN